MPTPDDNLKALHLTLPPAPKPMAVYRPCLQVGNLLYLSGHVPLNADGSLHTGVVGAGLTTEQGYAAAKQVGLAALATVVAHCGSLAKVKRLIKTLGWVNSAPGFGDQPKVMNGWSELMRDVFGPDAGVGVRSAVGANGLPSNVAVEVESLFELHAG